MPRSPAATEAMRPALRTCIRSLALVLTAWCLIGCAAVAPAVPPQTALPSASAPTASPPTAAPSATPSPTPPPSPTPAPSPTRPFPEPGLPLSSLSYRIPLTLRLVTEHTALLYLELAETSPGQVYLLTPGQDAPAAEARLSAGESRHAILFEGLAPGTRYQAVVALGGEQGEPQQPSFLSRAWGPLVFQTASEAENLRIGVIGDASFGDPATTALVEQMAAADLDLVLHTGDVVDETSQGVNPFDSYAAKFYLPFKPLLRQMPVYTVPGNHDYDLDIRWEGEPFYYRAFPGFPDERHPGQGPVGRNQYYAFARQGIQFVMLDSQVFFGVAGREAQNAWLAERLADPAYRATIPVFHVSPYQSSSVHPTDSLPVRAGWPPLFESARVPLVLSGHFHEYERLSVNQITYLVSGGGSSTLYAPGVKLPQSQVQARRTHFVLIEVGADRLILTAIALGGEQLDRFEVPLP